MAPRQDTPVTTLEDATELVQASIQSDLRSYADADPDRRVRIDKLISEIDVADSNSIIFFGARRRRSQRDGGHPARL